MRPLLSLIFAVLVLTLGVRSPAAAQPDPRAAVERLFREPVEDAWFTEAFREKVPVGQVKEIVADLLERFGPLQAVSGDSGSFTAAFETAEVPVELHLDAEGRITGLFFRPAVAVAASVEDHVAAIAALPGEVSVLVTTDGERKAAHAEDAVLAVGSAAKLAILKALADAVDGGRLRWDEVVALDPAWRSLPTGILQDWPAETPLTLATLANLMISISDNTATDALIDLVGRAAVEAVTPRNAPFPSTAELFRIKADPALRRAWSEGDADARQALLERTANLPLPAPEALGAPTPDVEWFMSATEICALLEAVGHLPTMRINPGVAERRDWKSIAFKGGSEAGVLNLSTRLEDGDGHAHCVVATWNAGASLDDERLLASYRGILRALKSGEAAGE